MVTGRLIQNDGMYYAILNLKHPDGSRLQKRFQLELPVKNNQRNAQQRLAELCQEYTRLQELQNNSTNVLFSDFIYVYFKGKQEQLSPTTYRNYLHCIDKHIAPYFSGKTVRAISPKDIAAYYNNLQAQGLSSTTILHHHAVLSQCFHEAYKHDIIVLDPMTKVDRPKRAKFEAQYYSADEVRQLLEAVQGNYIEVPVVLTLFYGLRRSEVLGLRWSDIDFEAGTIFIHHSVVETVVDGKYTVIDKTTMKNSAACRTLPLSDMTAALLHDEQNRKAKFQSEYVCTNEKGELIKPDTLYQAFARLLEEKGLRHIRYHDLRHSTASLLISARTPLIEVQHWLGHSTMLTTADLYSHLDYSTKEQCANTMKKI